MWANIGHGHVRTNPRRFAKLHRPPIKFVLGSPLPLCYIEGPLSARRRTTHLLMHMAFAQGLTGRDAAVLASTRAARPILASGRPGSHKWVQKTQSAIYRSLNKDIQVVNAAATVEETSTSYVLLFRAQEGTTGTLSLENKSSCLALLLCCISVTDCSAI